MSMTRQYRCIPRLLLLLGVLSLSLLGGCVKGGVKGGEAVSPNEKKLPYGLSMNIPAGWTVVEQIRAESASKAALDARRKKGEAIQLIRAEGPPGVRNTPSAIGITLVNEDGNFLPRQHAENITPDEFATMAKSMIQRDKELARKNKSKSRTLDTTLSRETIGGRTAILQRITATDGNGVPARLIGWDIYLQDGAGIAVRSGCDPENPGAENELVNIVRSLRIQ